MLGSGATGSMFAILLPTIGLPITMVKQLAVIEIEVCWPIGAPSSPPNAGANPEGGENGSLNSTNSISASVRT
jgi:hypothetical protein